KTIGDYGFSQPVPLLLRSSSFVERLDRGHTIALDDPIAAARFVAEEVESWRDQGIFYFVPCVFEDAAIAVLALGRKDTDEPFNSEDLALLTAVAGQRSAERRVGKECGSCVWTSHELVKIDVTCCKTTAWY